MARLAEQEVLQQLADLSSKTKGLFWLAYSGGLDSQVLLKLALQAIPLAQLRAVHINHGLNAQADVWQEHCRSYCERLSIEFVCKKVEIDQSASSPEQQAREARYTAFEALINEGEYILMAHHQDDQMETVFYRLLRGSGPRGLAGMPVQRKLGPGMLFRPLLNYRKEDLIEYAEKSGLTWIEDDSNSNISFDRNYLRQEIIPSLKARWPEAGKSIQRSAELSSESEHLLKDLAKLDAGEHFDSKQSTLSLELLNGMGAIRQRNLLRYWFQCLAESCDIPVPGYEELRRIVEEVIPAVEDAQPLVSWKHAGIDVQLRRFANKLYVLKNFPAEISHAPIVVQIDEGLELGANLGRINLVNVSNGGVSYRAGDELEIRFDCAQVEAKPAGRKTRSFKKLYQDYAVPPWLRERIPLLFINGKLAAVADLFVCHEMLAEEGQKQLKINWLRTDIHCGY